MAEIAAREGVIEGREAEIVGTEVRIVEREEGIATGNPTSPAGTGKCEEAEEEECVAG